MATKYLSCTETAKFVRKALKESFPGVKFSVRSDSYANGASINVSWFDGPTVEKVNAVTRQFEGASFDGMTDMKSYHESFHNGETVHFGADFVISSRSYSQNFLTAVTSWYCQRFGYAVPTIEVTADGSAHIFREGDIRVDDEYLSRLIWRECHKLNEEQLSQLEDPQIEKTIPAEELQEECVSVVEQPQEEIFVQEENEEQTNIIEFPRARSARVQMASDVLDVLKESTVNGNVLYLPKKRLERDLYLAVNEVLSRLGGTWNRKAKGHVFESDPREALRAALNNGEVPEKNPTAYFPTPEPLIESILSAHPLPQDTRRILEPSAGTGNIARAIEIYCNIHGIHATLDCCEIAEKYQKQLLEQHFFLVHDDFLRYHPLSRYDVIVMNPPFALNDDPLAYITHIEHAWSLLSPGGLLLAIAPAGFAFRQDKRIVQLRTLVEQYGSFEELPKSAFKESGTEVNTVLISLYKNF